MTTCVTAVQLPPGGRLTVATTSRLLASLRTPALQGAELLEKVVEEYCVEFEQRRAPTTTRLVVQ